MTAGIYRLLLRLCPREFRERFGPELLATAQQLEHQQRGIRRRTAMLLDALGTAAALHREYRHERRHLHLGGPPMRSGTFARDLRFAVRGLRRTPGFAVFVIVIMALAIGANGALFGIAERLLLSGPDHVEQPNAVRRVYVTAHPPGMREFTTSGVGHVLYDLVRTSGGPFTAVGSYQSGEGTIGRGDAARSAIVGYASATFFPLLGVEPLLGRSFTEAENAASGAQRVAVISHRLWLQDFAATPDVLGRPVIANDETYTIVGVAPAGFTGAELGPTDLWLPINLLGPRITSDWTTTWSAQWLEVIVRLADGVTAESAGSVLTTRLRAAYDGDERSMKEARVWLGELSRSSDGDRPAEAVIVRWLWGVALVVLLIATANIINLQLARGASRMREVGVRLALGASRAAITRMLVLESTLLALAGGLGGLAIAALIGTAARTQLLDAIEWPSSPVNWSVVVGSLLLAAGIGMVTGAVPAVGLTRRSLASAMRTGARDGGGQRLRLRAVLTVVQGTLCVALLIGAGLFVRSTWNARTLALGFDAGQVLVAEVTRTRLSGIPEHLRAAERLRRRAFLGATAERVRALPGVEDAAVAVGLPFGNRFSLRIGVPGMDALPQVATGGPGISAVGPGYFRTMGTGIRRGRAFTAADRDGSAPVAIISQFMATTVWPGLDPIGQCLTIGDAPAPCATIVGIAENTHRSRLVEQPRMHVYIPAGQERGFGGDVLVVRAEDPAAIAEMVRRTLVEADGTITYVKAESLKSRIDPEVRSWELGMTTLLFSGCLALVVAAVGIYSVISFIVADRRREIGVRMALGAQQTQVASLVLRRSCGMAALGAAAGVVIAAVAAPRIQPMLFNVSARDPLVYAAVSALLLAVALLASAAPCRRALRVDPIEALRVE